MSSILNNNSSCLDGPSEIRSLSNFGPIAGLDIASGYAKDYYIARFDLRCQRSISTDGELVIGQFDTTFDLTAYGPKIRLSPCAAH